MRETAPPQLDRHGPTPIFAQVRALLERAIAEGELTPHRRIPSERELSAQLGVSRMTVRQALTAMIGDGSLYTRSGKGTYVAERKIEQPLGRLTSFTEDTRARGRRPSSRVLAAELIAAPLELAQVLGIAPGWEIVRVKRLRLADADPVAVETAHLPHALVPGLLDADLGAQSLYALLHERYGLVLARAKQTIEAALPSPEERDLLALPPRVPVLRIHRSTAEESGRIVEFVQAAYRGDRYQLHVELR